MLALLIWVFALYGIGNILWKVIRYLIIKNGRGVPVTAVLVVQEGSSYIEGILRTLTTAEPFVKREFDVVVVDCGSKDDTVRIVEMIARKQGAVHLVQTDGEPYLVLSQLIGQKGQNIHCIFDLRDKVSPFEVVPTLAAFWNETSVNSKSIN